MPKPFAMQSLLELAQRRTDVAAAQLGVVNGQVREMEQRLELLLGYRAEYTAHLERAAKNGMNSVGWRNFLEFIERIDLAVEQQRGALAQARLRVQASQRDWHARQRTLKSFDTLSERHRRAEQKLEARQEQKEQDGFALRLFLARRTAAG
jgi:flagellar FliJ protein